jgi:hypothetical protein
MTMAKKSKTAAVVESKEGVGEEAPKPLFRRINFYVDELPGCCGVGVIHAFKEEDEYKHNSFGHRKRTKRRFFTREEQAQACYEKLLKFLTGEIDDYTFGYATYNTYIITLVSNYKDKGADDQGQFPELQDVLLANGWQINQVVVNPNHDNEITMFSKYDPTWGQDAEEEDEDDEYDDDEDDD